MEAMELLERLEGRGIRLVVNGDKLRCAPRDAVDGSLLQELREHKAELLKLLGERKPQVPEAIRGTETGLGPETEDQKAHRLIGKLGWCALQSAALGGEIIVLAKDEAVMVPAPWDAYPRYTLEEIDGLVGVSREHLKRIHSSKNIFGGRIQPGEGGAVQMERARSPLKPA